MGSAFSIGSVPVRNRVLLAPMSGITDVPFRQLAWKFGAGMVVCEMVACEALVTGRQEMKNKAESAGLPVHVVQLSGRQPKWMAEGVRVAEAAGADIVDINMGCPSKRVTTGYSGSALMRDLDHAMRLIEATVEAATVPVTLKMRLGWDENSINAPELARRAVDGGVAMITVHGRTRCQFYKGKADWKAVQAVRQVIDVPLVVNGDICSLIDAEVALEFSGADAVMVGRGSYGAPWLPGAIAEGFERGVEPNSPEGQELLDIALEHYDAMLAFYGRAFGVRQARKHLGWYLDRLEPSADLTNLRRTILTADDPKLVCSTLQTAVCNMVPRKVA